MKLSLNKIKVFSALAFSAVLFLLPTSLWAQTFTKEEQDFIQSSSPITLRFFFGQAPHSYVTADGSLSGISVDVMKKISDMSGLSFQYEAIDKNLHLSSLLDDFTDGLVVGVLEDFSLLESSGYIMSNPYFTDNIALVSHRNSTFHNPTDGESFILAIPHFYVQLETFVRERYPSFTIVYYRGIDEGLELLLRGNVDFVAHNMNQLMNRLTRPRYYNLSLMPSLFMDEQMCAVGVSTEKNTMAVSIINKCIDALPMGFITEVTLQHNVETTYHIRFIDILYLYRVQIVIVLVLLGISIFFLVSWLRTRDRDYDELSKMNTRLTFAMEQANEAAQAKSRFLLRISHDIRTPMNAIVGAVDVAEMMERRNDITMENRLHVIEQIRNATFSMEKLVDDIITRANALEGLVELREQPFNLGHVVKLLENELKMSVSGKVNWVSATRDPALDRQVIGDRDKFTELMDFLMEDILCFPHPLRSLNISSRLHDFGEGVVYYHLKATMVSGITIGREIAEDSRRIPLANMADVLGGAISYDVYNDICYDISVTVPFQISSKKADTDYGAENDAVTELMNFNSKKKLHMLVVDDNEINVLIAQNLLKACNIETDAVYNGLECLKAIESSESGTYDAILMDIRMPVMNGNDATRAIRHSRHPDGAGIPIYAFSANYATTDIAASINAGVDGYLKKPLEVQKLLKMLNSL